MYLLLKYLHILLSVALFGHIFASLYALRLARRGKPEQLAAVLSVEGRIGQAMGPASLLVVISGVVLTWTHYSFKMTWVWLSLVLYGVIVALGPGFVDPAIRKALAASSPETDAYAAKAQAGLSAMALATTLIIALMVYRPA